MLDVPVGEERSRRDLNAELRHYEHADEDYAFPRSASPSRAKASPGRWSTAARRVRFSVHRPFLAAQRRHNVLPIWDLCHYGYPDDLDPYSRPGHFVPASPPMPGPPRAIVAERAHHGPLCIGPINEPTFWGYMGGEWGWCAPFGKSREDRLRFTTVLARADIAACKAIRQDFPTPASSTSTR